MHGQKNQSIQVPTLLIPTTLTAEPPTTFNYSMNTVVFLEDQSQSSVEDFLSKALLTTDLLSPSSLKSHSDEEISFALTVTANRIQQDNAFIRKTFHSNQFQTIFQAPKTMHYYKAVPGGLTISGLYFQPRIIHTKEYTACNCVEQSACSAQAIYFNDNRAMYV